MNYLDKKHFKCSWIVFPNSVLEQLSQIIFSQILFYQSVIDLQCWVSFRFTASSVTQSCLTLCDPWTAAHQASLSLTNSWCLLKLLSTELVMPSNHLILCRPLLFLPSILLSIKVFSSESVLCITWPNYWSFSISPSSEYSGLISFRIDCGLLAVQGTLQHHNSKASILRHSAFFMIHLSYPYVTTGRSIALTIWTLVAKWCLCFLIRCLGLS